MRYSPCLNLGRNFLKLCFEVKTLYTEARCHCGYGARNRAWPSSLADGSVVPQCAATLLRHPECNDRLNGLTHTPGRVPSLNDLLPRLATYALLRAYAAANSRPMTSR